MVSGYPDEHSRRVVRKPAARSPSANGRRQPASALRCTARTRRRGVLPPGGRTQPRLRRQALHGRAGRILCSCRAVSDIPSSSPGDRCAACRSPRPPGSRTSSQQRGSPRISARPARTHRTRHATLARRAQGGSCASQTALRGPDRHPGHRPRRPAMAEDHKTGRRPGP
jgi:hypothetical protein